MNRRRAVGAILSLGLVLTACTSGSGTVGSGDGGDTTPADVPSSPDVVPPAEDGPGSALAALEELCTLPRPRVDGGSDVPAEGPTPPTIAEVMRQVERIRGFGFDRPVVADPVTQQEIAGRFSEILDAALPEGFYARRSVAWETIGVIPEGTNIRDELFEYAGSQFIGFYNTLTGELVFIGEEEPSPYDRTTLAHELTHALDDQRFGLESIDVLGAECRDEEAQAELALIEGNATFFMLRWAQTFLSLEEQLELGTEAAAQSPPPSDIPPFISAIQEWPYLDGLTFVTRLESEGGVDAIDAAFADMPVTTEQILHPERYPNDLPVPVDVPDLAPELGNGWEDLDVQAVGEMWLDLALALRLDDPDAASAAAGWDGGIYRAWTDGEDAAVVLATAWDTDVDAQEFAGAMTSWLAGGEQDATVLPVEGSSVRVLFASTPETLSLLEAATD